MSYVSSHVAAKNAKDRRRVLGAFRRAQAVSPAGAQTLASLALEEDRMFRRLRDDDVIRSAGGARFYLDEQRLAEVNAQNARLGLLFAAIVAMVIVLVLLLRR
jgi:hypothetical protein